MSTFEIRCAICKKKWKADTITADLVTFWRKKRFKRSYLTCAKCGANSDFDVVKLVILRREAEEAQFMCPVSGCWGLALPDKRKRFSCVDCGGRWADDTALFAAIALIVKRYRHRKRVYEKKGRGWKPVAAGKQPDDWQDLVGEREVVEDPDES